MRVIPQVILVAVLAGGTAVADEWSKNFAIAGRPELRVETDDGSVTIRPGDARKIVARVTTIGWKIVPGEVEVHESQTGDRVEVVVKKTRRPFGFNFNNRSIHLDLEVPRQIQSDIRTGDGNIDIQGITGETRLRTGDGHIEAIEIDGSVRAESGDGHVRVRGRFDLLTVHTGDGSVEADVLPGSKMSSAWHMETGDGGVTLRLPPNFGADLELHTGDGGISMDLPALSGVNGRHDGEAQRRWRVLVGEDG